MKSRGTAWLLLAACFAGGVAFTKDANHGAAAAFLTSCTGAGGRFRVCGIGAAQPAWTCLLGDRRIAQFGSPRGACPARFSATDPASRVGRIGPAPLLPAWWHGGGQRGTTSRQAAPQRKDGVGSGPGEGDARNVTTGKSGRESERYSAGGRIGSAGGARWSRAASSPVPPRALPRAPPPPSPAPPPRAPAPKSAGGAPQSAAPKSGAPRAPRGATGAGVAVPVPASGGSSKTPKDVRGGRNAEGGSRGSGGAAPRGGGGGSKP